MKQALIVAALAHAGLCANSQVLSVSNVTAARGQKANVEISVASPAASLPLALQWELEVPAPMLMSATPQAGDAAAKSGKSIACSGQWKKAPSTYLFRCILAGGQSTIVDGVVATLELHVPAAGKSGKFDVAVRRAHAVTTEMKKVQIRDAQGSITVPK